MSVAFFDLDKTLISVNSANLWVRLEWRKGRLSKNQLLKLSSGLLRYGLGLGNQERHFLEAISHMKGQRYADLQADATHFYQSHIRHLFRPGALDALQQHRKRDDRIVLLTTSPHTLASLVELDLELDGCLSTQFEVDPQGYCTGNTIGPLCYGIGKVEVAAAWLKTNKVPIKACTFYSDSFTDLPMLEAVGRPIVVNPDIRLKRAALSKQWPIVDWGVPNGQK